LFLASRRRTGKRIRLSWICWPESQNERRQRRLKSRLPGYWSRSRGSCRFRARRSSIEWKKILEPLTSNFRPMIFANWMSQAPRSRRKARAIPKNCKNWWDAQRFSRSTRAIAESSDPYPLQTGEG